MVATEISSEDVGTEETVGLSSIAGKIHPTSGLTRFQYQLPLEDNITRSSSNYHPSNNFNVHVEVSSNRSNSNSSGVVRDPVCVLSTPGGKVYIVLPAIATARSVTTILSAGR